jgi:hypothetical protein
MRRSAALFLVLIAAAIAGNLALAHGQTAGPDSIQVDMDVVYQTGGKVMMDVARPATPGPHPAVVTIGGDAFRTVARSTHETLIRKLAGRGYVAAAIDYRVGGRSQFPAPLQDVKAAVRFLRANAERFGIDPARICALGEAAGAPLALLTALTPAVADFDSGSNRELPSALSCVVTLSAVSDFSRAYAGSTIASESYPPHLELPDGGRATAAVQSPTPGQRQHARDHDQSRRARRSRPGRHDRPHRRRWRRRAAPDLVLGLRYPRQRQRPALGLSRATHPRADVVWRCRARSAHAVADDRQHCGGEVRRCGRRGP